jgi:hypothetical protein
MSMASKDRLLARVSEWSTLVVLAGITTLPLLLPEHKRPPVHHAPAVTAPPPRVETHAAVPPAPAVTTSRAPAEVAPKPVATPQTGPAAPAGEPVPDVWTEAEQTAGLRECLRLLAPIAAEVELDEPIKKGPCGMAAPVVLHSVGTTAKVEFHPAPEMSCRLAARLARWIDTVLQPTAREVLGSRVTRVIGAGSYSCRNMYSNPHLPLSEHATGSAVDIEGFVTADGRTIRVAKGWGPTERDIAAAQKKAAEAAKVAARKKDEKSTKGGTETASSEKKAPDEAKVHKAGYKSEHGSVAVVPAAATLTAANTVEAAFLRRLHSGACTVFGTVLGPEANDAHRDHFHFDVKERKRRGICH